MDNRRPKHFGEKSHGLERVDDNFNAPSVRTARRTATRCTQLRELFIMLGCGGGITDRTRLAKANATDALVSGPRLAAGRHWFCDWIKADVHPHQQHNAAHYGRPEFPSWFWWSTAVCGGILLCCNNDRGDVADIFRKPQYLDPDTLSADSIAPWPRPVTT